MKARMLKAAGWVLGGNLGGQLIRLGSNLVLTRLLLPESFGLVAAVNTLYFGLVMLSDLGVWQSVVRSPRGLEPRYLGTAWSLQLIRGGLLMLGVLLAALALSHVAGAGHAPAGSVYADPRLPPMMAAFALCALLQGLESMRIATTQRALDTGRLTRIELAAQLASTLLTISLAWATRSPWALVVGTVAYSALRTGLSHLWLPGPSVRPCWEPADARDIFGFGKWIFASSIIGFLAAHGEKLLLGGLFDSATFGLYAIASTLLFAVVGAYGALNAHVVFGGLAEAGRAEGAQAAALYARVQRIADAVLGLAAGGLYALGHWVVTVLYDPRYAAAGPMLQLLALGLVALRYQVVEQLMFARGQPAWVMANNALRALALVLLVPPGMAHGGIEGAVLAVALAQFASWPLSLLYKWRTGLFTAASEAWWLPALVAGAALGWIADRALTAIARWLT